MGMILTIDFETNDPYFKKMGPGWAYGLCEVLCMGYSINTGTSEIIKDIMDERVEEILSHSNLTIVAHNAQYDIGILASKYPWILTKPDITFVDTIILAKLHNNIETSYSLDSLSKKYLKQQKLSGNLGKVVLDHRLINCKDRTTALSKTKATNFAKNNMKKIYEVAPKVVEDYCKIDVDLAGSLYNYYLSVIPDAAPMIQRYSDLLKLLIKSRMRGVCVNSEKLYNIKQTLNKKIDAILAELIKESGNKEFNPQSTANVVQLLLKHGYEIPLTEKGNPSVTAEWLKKQKHSVCKKIIEYRTMRKLSRNFCDNVLKMQSLLPEEYKGRIYPSLSILGAETGRFSSSKPNIQQIPNAKKHKEVGLLIRSAYEAAPNKLWASIDYSAQEPRLQVHFASLIKAEGADILELEYNKNPNLDLHEMVAKLTGVSRNEAKTVNLGLCLHPDTLVLTNNGFKKLIDVKPNDLVFDGNEYVSHDGIICQGEKEIIWKNKIGLTMDHEIMTEHSWQEWKEVHINQNLFQSGLDLATSQYKSFLLTKILEDVSDIGTLEGNVTVEELGNIIQRIYRNKEMQNVIIATGTEERTTSEADSEIEFTPRVEDAIVRKIETMNRMEEEGLLFPTSSRKTITLLLTILKHYQGMTTQQMTWTELITIKDIVEVIFDLLLGEKTTIIEGQSNNYKEKTTVYDIKNAGKLHRFTILTDSGLLIVHNCYGMGKDKLCRSLGISRTQGDILLDNFHNKLPYLSVLDKKCKENFKKNKYIKTIGGRKLRLPAPKFDPETGRYRSLEYKGLNQLIQGSGADQIISALLDLDKQGFIVLFSVHDEINLEVSNLQEALQAKHIMENTIKLKVPVVAELRLGTSWGNGEEVPDENMTRGEVNGKYENQN